MLCSSCKKPIDNKETIVEKIKIQGIEIENVLCTECAEKKSKTTKTLVTPPQKQITVEIAYKTALWGIIGASAGAILFIIISILTKTYFWFIGILISFGAILLVQKKVDLEFFIQKIILILITSTIYIASVVFVELVLYVRMESLQLFDINPLYILFSIPMVIGFVITNGFQLLFIASNILIVLTTRNKNSVS